MPQVFLSYSRKDLAFVEQLAADLKSNGLDIWYDLSGLEGGVRWNREIERAIRDSQYMIVVLSPDSMEAEWVDKEFLLASRLKIKIVPLLYRTCELRLAYINLQYIDIQGRKYKQNFNQILHALNVRPKPVVPNKLTLSNGMGFMRVPGGKFLMGITKENKVGFDNERPQHTVEIPYDYWMARFPVTNEQYNLYIKTTKGIKHPVDDWEKKQDHPIRFVTWNDAIAYCQWLNDLLKSELPSDLVLCLPTEAEWEKAARGKMGNEWPWGYAFDKNKCNSYEDGKGGTKSVGLYSPRGDSPYSCADIVGNVREWTHSLFMSYPYQVGDGREDEKISGRRVLRGGFFRDLVRDVRCAYRLDYDIYDYVGFRVVAAPSISDIINR